MADDQHIDHLYQNYKAKPTQENLASVVKGLEPTINYALSSVGSFDDPLVHGKARIYAANAVEKYDPSFGASLPTHVSSQLRQLSRTARQSRSPVKLPERIQLDSYRMNQSIKSFEDTHGREPDTLELADHSGMPVERIAKVRKYQMAVPTEGAVGDAFQESEPDFEKEAVDYVYHDCDHTDRRILEMKTGYGGHPVTSPKETAMKLNLTPTQLTRRSMRLTKRINEIQAGLGKL